MSYSLRKGLGPISDHMSPQDCGKKRRPQAQKWPVKVLGYWWWTAVSQQSSFYMWEKPTSQCNYLAILWRLQSLREVNGRPQDFGYQGQHLEEEREGIYFGKKFKLSQWDGLASNSTFCLCQGWQPELEPWGKRTDHSKSSFDLHTCTMACMYMCTCAHMQIWNK